MLPNLNPLKRIEENQNAIREQIPHIEERVENIERLQRQIQQIEIQQIQIQQTIQGYGEQINRRLEQAWRSQRGG